MDTNEFIRDAIQRGMRDGIDMLDEASRLVFLTSEAEVYCDKDGIDSFIDRYGKAGLQLAADAFEAVGGEAIAAGLRDIARALPKAPEFLLSGVNHLITEQAGYEYEGIAAAIQRAQRRAP